MSTKQERMYIRIEQHGNDLCRIFKLDADPISLSKRIFSIEYKAHRLAEDYTNGEIETDQYEVAAQKLLIRLSKIIGKNNMRKVFLNGDPRGYALKLTEKASKSVKIHKDWGGYGILAPDFRE